MAEGPGGREAGRVRLKVVPDTSEVYEELRKLKAEIEKMSFKIKVELDTDDLRQELQRLQTLVNSNPIKIPTEWDDPGRLRVDEPDDVTIRVRTESEGDSPEDFLDDLTEKTHHAKVELDADTEGFLERLKLELAALMRQLGKYEVPIGSELEADYYQALGEAKKLKKFLEQAMKGVDVDVDLDDDEVRNELRFSLRELQEYAKRHAIDVKVELEDRGLLSELGAELARAEAAVRKIDVPIGFEARHGEMLAQIAQMKATLKRLGDLDIELGVDDREALNDMAFAIRKMQAYARMHSVDVKVKADRSQLDRFNNVLGGMAGKLARTFSIPNLTQQAGQIKALAAAVTAFSPHLAVLAGDLTKFATGGILTIPAAAGAAAAGITTLKMAFSGMGEAITTGDPEVLAEALRSMAPAAGEVVLALRGISEQFATMGKDVQQSVFVGIAGPLKALATSALPVLKTGLKDVGNAFNVTFKEIIKGSQDLVKNGVLKDVLAGTAAAGREAAKGIQPLIGAFGTLAQVGAKYLPQFGKLLADAGKAFQDWVNGMKASGDLDNLFAGFLQGLRDIASIGGSAFSILSSIFKAAQNAGGQGLSGFATVMQSIAAMFKDPSFQQALTAFFKGINDGMAALGSALKEGGGEGFKQLLMTLGEIARQVGPVLGEIFKVIGSAFAIIAPYLREVVQILGPAIQKFLQSMKPHIDKLMEALGPVIKVVAEIIADTLPLLADTLGPIIEVVAVVIGWIGKLLQFLKPIIPIVITIIVNFLVVFRVAKLLATGFKLISGAVKLLGPLFKNLIGWVISAAKNLGAQFTKMWKYAVALKDKVISAFKNMVGGVTSWLKNLGGKIKGFFTETLPNALKDIGGKMLEIGKNIITGIWNGISSAGGWLKDKFGSFLSEHLPDWAKKILGIESPSKVFAAIGVQVAAGLSKGILDSSSAMRADMKRFVGMYRRAIEDPIAKEFRAIGQFAGNELMVGLRGTADQAVNVVKELVDRLRSQADKIFDRTQEQAEAFNEKMTAAAQRIADQRARVTAAEKEAAAARAKNALAIRQEQLSQQQLLLRQQQIDQQIRAAKNPKQSKTDHTIDIREATRDIDILKRKLDVLRRTTDKTAAGRVAIARRIADMEEQIHDKQVQIQKWRADANKKTQVDLNKIKQLELQRQQIQISIQKSKLRMSQLDSGATAKIAKEKAALAKLQAEYNKIAKERAKVLSEGAQAEARAMWTAQYIENLEKAIEATATARDKIREELEKARNELESIMDKMADYVDGVMKNIQSSMNITRAFDAEEQARTMGASMKDVLGEVAKQGGAIGQFAQGWANRISAALSGSSGETASAVLEEMRESIKNLGPQIGKEQANLLTQLRAMVDGAITNTQTAGSQSVVDRAKAELKKVADFVGTVKRLASMKLNSTWLDQVIQAGPFSDTVDAFRDMSQAQVDELNNVMTEMNAHAKEIGMTGAEAMYGAGRDAVQQLIKGLESQEAALTAAIDRMAKQIADALTIGVGVKVDLEAPGANTAAGVRIPAPPGPGDPTSQPPNIAININQNPDGGWGASAGYVPPWMDSTIRRAARQRAGV